MSKIENELTLPRARISVNAYSNSAIIEVDQKNLSAESEKCKSDAEEVVKKCRATFDTGRTKPVEYRKEQLKNLLRLIDENNNLLEDALLKDLRKCSMESQMTEIEYLRNDIRGVLKHVDKWAKPERVHKPVINIFDDLYIYKDPYGVVLIIGAWNYPINLTLSPLVGAIAAGNCAVIKPSEISIATAQALADLLPKYLDKDAYQVYLGGIQETTEILKQRFDYIFYTGSTMVGKIVQEAASKHLTPVTLELGGKSPTYIDETVDMEITTKRVLWGKLINAGQTCVAPDYILCNKQVQEKFLQIAPKVLKEWYGENIKASPDYARIATKKHYDRLTKFLEDKSKIALGGTCDPTERYIEPTIIVNVYGSEPVMQEEIFGPILPIVNVRDVFEAVNFVNSREKPLALYVFTTNKKDREIILNNTSSGGVAINDTVMHLLPDTLPFGGVGCSGMGAYHGKASFDTFTHKKSVLKKGFNVCVEKMTAIKYPPYTDGKLKYLTKAGRHRGNVSFGFLWSLFFFMLGAALTAVFFYFLKS